MRLPGAVSGPCLFAAKLSYDLGDVITGRLGHDRAIQRREKPSLAATCGRSGSVWANAGSPIPGLGVEHGACEAIRAGRLRAATAVRSKPMTAACPP